MHHGFRLADKITVFSAVLVLTTMSAEAQVGPESAHAVIDRAAQALGGIDRIRKLRNITLYGYGQYAMVDESISPSTYAPMKYQAANALRRVYDLEHGRFQMLERHNMLYPFLISAGHDFLPVNLILDGDIAYNVSTEFSDEAASPRAPRWNVDLFDPPGIHMRRMWMLNNPIALVRNALDPHTKLSTPRHEGSYAVLDMAFKEGDRLTAGFSSDHLPAWVRWSSPNANLGEVTFTTYFTGYASIDGLLLPLGYDTRLDWRDTDYFRLYLDHYGIDEQIADLAAPANIRALPEPASDPVPPITAEPIATHLWRLSPSGTTVIEFKDHLTLFELGVPGEQAKSVLAFARTLVSGKPVTQVIVSHHHFDHSAGLREAVANGLTVISRRQNESIFREMISHLDPDFSDDLAKSPRALKFIPVDERLMLSDETMELEVLWARNNIHMADAVLAYAPVQKVMMEADIATAAYDYQFWPDNFRDLIDYYKLDVEKDSPVHSVWPEHPGVLTIEQVYQLIRGGTQRARQRCASELSRGIYFPGCPVWSTRY